MTRQNFNPQGGAHLPRTNLGPLRQAMRNANINGLHIPHQDECRSEFPPQRNRRLTWATGFDGSAGTALVFDNHAHLFVDGRYSLQARMQTDTSLFDIHDLNDPGPAGWIAKNATRKCRIGFDPHLITTAEHKQLLNATCSAQAELIALDTPVLDAAWTNRPPETSYKVRPWKLSCSGQSAADKISAICSHLQTQQTDHLLMTSDVSIAWTFNIRADNIPYCPAPPARAIINADGSAQLFLDPRHTDSQLLSHLGKQVTLNHPDTLERHLTSLDGKKVSLDPNNAPCWMVNTLNNAHIVLENDPSELPRARKNPVELEHARHAHTLDGAALAQFLCWLESATDITEIDAAQQLESFRENTGALRDIAFDTIAGSGPHGAIIHYRVNTTTNRKLKKGDLFLVDSGGQYDAATTDVTRTIAIGPARTEEKRLYTLVLKCHLALSMARFPENTPGLALDAIARSAMWRAGMDYAHGTGHGVGAFLNVHEGPQKIARQNSSQVMLPGMIISNEPGYYRPGAFGIRIENLQYVTDPYPIDGGDNSMMGFEILTLAPYDRSLIMVEHLDQNEQDYIDAYHSRVYQTLSNMVDSKTAKWLERACARLTNN